MRLSVEQQIGSFILNGTEAIVYLYNELIPTAWLSDSILLVILPFANFDSVTQMGNQILHHINPVENPKMEFNKI